MLMKLLAGLGFLVAAIGIYLLLSEKVGSWANMAIGLIQITIKSGTSSIVEAFRGGV